MHLKATAHFYGAEASLGSGSSGSADLHKPRLSICSAEDGAQPGCDPEILPRSCEDLMSWKGVSESLGYVFTDPWWGQLGTVRDGQLYM